MVNESVIKSSRRWTTFCLEMTHLSRALSSLRALQSASLSTQFAEIVYWHKSPRPYMRTSPLSCWPHPLSWAKASLPKPRLSTEEGSWSVMLSRFINSWAGSYYWPSLVFRRSVFNSRTAIAGAVIGLLLVFYNSEFELYWGAVFLRSVHIFMIFEVKLE